MYLPLAVQVCLVRGNIFERENLKQYHLKVLSLIWIHFADFHFLFIQKGITTKENQNLYIKIWQKVHSNKPT